MVLADFFMSGFEVAVLASEWSFGARIREVTVQVAPLQTLPTLVRTHHIHKLTVSIVYIHMRVELSQLSNPTAATILPSTPNLHCKNLPPPVLIKHHAGSAYFGLAHGTVTCPIGLKGLFEAALAEVMSATWSQVWVSRDQQAERTFIILEQGRRVHEVFVVSTGHRVGQDTKLVSPRSLALALP